MAIPEPRQHLKRLIEEKVRGSATALSDLPYDVVPYIADAVLELFPDVEVKYAAESKGAFIATDAAGTLIAPTHTRYVLRTSPEPVQDGPGGHVGTPDPGTADCGCPITVQAVRILRHTPECSQRQSAERFIRAHFDDEPDTTGHPDMPERLAAFGATLTEDERRGWLDQTDAPEQKARHALDEAIAAALPLSSGRTRTALKRLRRELDRVDSIRANQQTAATREAS